MWRVAWEFDPSSYMEKNVENLMCFLVGNFSFKKEISALEMVSQFGIIFF